MARALGTVAALWRWPVVSMGGEPVNALRVDRRGVGGDRTHAVTHAGRPLTAGEEPRLLAWAASYPFNLDAGLDPARPPFAVVRSPHGASYRWGDPRLRAALAADLERPVELLRDVERVRGVVVTSLGAPAELRTNLHLALDGALDPQGELVLAGGVRLALVAPRERGGVEARVIVGGRIAVGERAELR